VSPTKFVYRKDATRFDVAYKFGEILNPFEKQRSGKERIDLLPTTVCDKIDMSPAAMPTRTYVPLLLAKWSHRGLDL